MRPRLTIVVAIAVGLGFVVDGLIWAPCMVADLPGLHDLTLRFGDLVQPHRVITSRGFEVVDVTLINHYVVLAMAALLAAVLYVTELGRIGLTLVSGSTRRPTLLKSPWLAHLAGGLLVGLFVAAIAPSPELQLRASGVAIDAHFIREWGSNALVFGLVICELAVIAIARSSELSAQLGWSEQIARLRRPRRRERPMLDASPSAAPVGIASDPFRDPPPSELESRLVRPSHAVPAPIAEDPSAPNPKLLS